MGEYMKPYHLLILSAVMLSGCNEVNYAKLGYQVKGCFADTTIRCNDIRLKFAIAETKLARQSLMDNKQQAMTEIGEANYNRMLALLDQKIKLFEDQRPNLYMRWFQGDKEDYREIDQGWAINAKIQALGHQIQTTMNHSNQPLTSTQPDSQHDSNPLLAEVIQPETDISDAPQTNTPSLPVQNVEENSSDHSSSNNIVKPRTIDCQITTVDTSHKGKCHFIAEKGGSFTLSSINSQNPLIGDTKTLHVYIVDKGIAEVDSLHEDGITTSWGTATRSQKQKACWVGDDFKICAW
jgi:hypothetical protein